MATANNDVNLLEAALAIAERWPVFPCDPATKHPLVETGFYAATTNVMTISKWWTVWPFAMIGIPTGAASGVWVLDIDYDSVKGVDGFKALAELESKHGVLPATLTVNTPRGGEHRYFLWHEGIGSSQSIVGPGIDVKGEGGYVIVPPSIRSDRKIYQWRDSTAASVDVSQWLIDFVVTPEPEPELKSKSNGSASSENNDRIRRYVEAAIDGVLNDVATAPKGTRNAALNKGAFRLGQFIGANVLGEALAISALESACRDNRSWQEDANECRRTIKSGLNAGKFHPAEIPEPETRNGDGRHHHDTGHAKTEAEQPDENECSSTAFTDPSALGEWEASMDSDSMNPRGWLLGNIFCRGFVSSLLGAGGTGKTALRHAQLMSLAIGRSLTGEHVFERCRVLIVSLEDDPDELRRRMLAIRLHYEIDKADLKGWLFLACPGAAGGKLMIEERRQLKRSKLADNLEAAIVARKIDVLSLDPFVKTHSVEENANSAIDDVVQLLSDMASKYNCAIDVPHHTSKGTAEAGNADRGRGASAAKDAWRIVHTLSAMSPEEAKAFDLPEEMRRSLVRMDSGKVNVTPPMASAKWFRLVGVPLGNGTDLYPNGDEVQTVEVWTPPATWDGVNNFIANQILNDIDAGLANGDRYSDGAAATVRAAWPIVVKHVPGKPEGPAREMIKQWLKSGVLCVEDYESPASRKTQKGLRVDPTKRPT